MINNEARIGNFTSSQIYRLMGNAKIKGELSAPALTYIEEKNIERKMRRSVEGEAYSREMSWGLFLESRVHNMLGLEYELTSQETDRHPTINCWSGSKDFIVKGVKVTDLKCYQYKNFSYYTDCLLSRDTEKLKSEFPKEYWQLVSNATINGTPKAEAICYCPFRSELEEIQELALDYIEPDAWKYRWIYETPIDNLPNLEDGGFYNNLNVFEFEVPKSDIEALTNKVLEAQKKLIQFHNKALAA
jgi:hypothetical protein